MNLRKYIYINTESGFEIYLFDGLINFGLFKSESFGNSLYFSIDWGE